jgi:hypothetical protein
MPKNGIEDYAIPELGLKIKVLEPLQAIHIQCEDPDGRGVSFDLRLDAIMPPAVRPGGGHFTQAMRTRGTLNLYGERFTIDGYASRDHSWGEERRETSRVMPPIGWIVGVVDERFAFHVLAFDSPELNPEWASRYTLPMASNLAWGYVYRDGVTYPVTRAAKRTYRERDGLTPRSVTLDFDDAGGGAYSFRGEVNAVLPWQTWQNMNVFFCQMRWTTPHGIAWGDLQDIQANDFVRTFAR